MRKHPARLRFFPVGLLTLVLMPAAAAQGSTVDWASGPSLEALLGIEPPAVLQASLVAVPAETASAGLTADEKPGHLLIALAKQLRDIRYRRGGSNPKTGFDCSGFVRYVFQHALGVSLPAGSAAQFRVGDTIDRRDMQPGDLVFFRIAGKRISHVGIYVAEGRFIHAPSAGKVVRVDSLEQTYWARRFAGARRPEAIART
ncbi:C40 family peptidase [Dokdonella koreensis]|uniref:Cell wall-associated hydrolase n=1 Tax=Dokdonella koreensis DS-123 TaxID=1300342 RepID=A0A160DTI9_9GAMM|nr:C40 family peptidase [Dokdonella koreensis]ANB17679.1 Cell wall-associated hydrolase [Dokdonella koreensis DS-123]